ncbi:MAG: hypothetical protein D6797_04225 [Bdellovibrio sp.]|nr:MAG: hypothetical protein D6797_04225 [Bdellovibrio sp.]
MLRRWLSLIILLLFHFPFYAQATVTITSVSGASYYDSSTTTIYGGFAGPEDAVNCPPNSDGKTCNNCSTLTSLSRPCNEKRAMNTSTIDISFKITDLSSSDPQGPGVAMMYTSDGATQIGSSSSSSFSPDQTATLSVAWDDICRADDSSSTDCDDTAGENTALSVRIGLDLDGQNGLDQSVEYTTITIHWHNPDASAATASVCGNGTGGICDFSIYPGDEKVYIENLQSDLVTDNNFKNLVSGIDAYALRLLFHTDGFSSVLPNVSSDFKEDLDIDSNGTVSSIVDRLENNTPYFFRLGVVDKAQNLLYVTSDTMIDDASNDPCDSTQVAASFDPDCKFSAKPDEVLGFLTDDLNCFVATAAFGSPLSKKVNDFRLFRDRYLMPSDLGKKMVHLYYKYSPPLAHWIAQSDLRRLATRIFLWPLWTLVWLTLYINPLVTLLLLGTILLIFINVWRRKHKKDAHV